MTKKSCGLKMCWTLRKKQLYPLRRPSSTTASRSVANRMTLIALLILCTFSTANSDGVPGFAPAYWPGPHVAEFSASSTYSSCRNIPLPADPGANVGRIWFDENDNLWITRDKIDPTAFRLKEALAAKKYTQFKSFDFGNIGLPPRWPVGPFAFDHERNLWALGGQLNTPGSKDLVEVLKSSSYTKYIHHSIPADFPIDIAVDHADNVWISSFAPGPADLRRDVFVLKKRDGYREATRFSSPCAAARLVTDQAGQVFASVDAGDSAVMQLIRTDSGLVCKRTVPDISNKPGPAAIRMDSEGNLWALWWSSQLHYSPPSQVIELTSASDFSQRKTFTIPRRVFGLTTDRRNDVWLTSPYPDVGYVGGAPPVQSTRRLPPQPTPEPDVTRLEAFSNHSRQKTYRVPGWPFGIAGDRSGNIWIANGGSDSGSVIELPASGDYSNQKTFDVPGNPYGIAVDSRSNVWVTGNFPGYNVAEVSHAGRGLARKLQVPGRAQSIAFDPDDNLWVADFQPGEFKLIQFLAGSNYRQSRHYSVKGNLFALAFDRAGNLWAAVAGCPQDRIANLIKSSGYQNEISYPVEGRPYGVAVDGQGNVWAAVAVEPKSEVKEFARSAGYSQIRSFEITGESPFAVDSRGDVWVQSFDYVETEGLTGTR